jgi:prolyl-tRNA synthetase
MMQDRKALQAGTSHFLGQNFAKASDIRFQSDQEDEEFAWTTSWGVSTRLIGGLIMTHSDDDGLVLPPAIAPAHAVLLPIAHKAKDFGAVMDYTEKLAGAMREIQYRGRPLEVEIDAREIGGARGWDWIKKGIPLRIEIGPRDIAKDAVFLARRDKSHKDKTAMGREQFLGSVCELLDDIQNTLYQRALAYRRQHTCKIDDTGDFYGYFTPRNKDKPEIHGGFAMSHWCGAEACEEKIKEDLTVTIRCIPFDQMEETGQCIYCGKPSNGRVIFAKAY